MRWFQRIGKLLILLGDVLVFYGSLWLALLVRHRAVPTEELFLRHAVPFSALFAAWVVAFYVGSLYRWHTIVLRSRLIGILLNVQAVNSVGAIACFYGIPAFGITPKTVLFLQLVFACAGIVLWRVFGVGILSLRRREPAVLVGAGEETRDLYHAVNERTVYPIEFTKWVDLDEFEGIHFADTLKRTCENGASLVVIDLKSERAREIVPELYKLIFSKVSFLQQSDVYEDFFDAIPISLVGYDWFLENVSSRAHFGYDIMKRFMDVFLSLVLMLAFLPVLPLVAIAAKLLQPGPILFTQDRVGRGDSIIRVLKLRTMTADPDPRNRRVTRLGAFLRRTRIDELPQLWNVLTGDLSLIGPRPEIPELVRHYTEQIPYYGMRHLITPGLSGWAQLLHRNHPHHDADVDETKTKLSYDLWYLKNRSVTLDTKIALLTVKTLLLREGR